MSVVLTQKTKMGIQVSEIETFLEKPEQLKKP